MIRRFRNRREAGSLLAKAVAPLASESPVVVALPRGGVPVAAEVALALHAPLDVMIVRKLGLPFQPELGMGAIGEDGVRVLDPAMVRSAQITADEIAAVEARERVELDRRVRCYRGERPMVPLNERTVLIVDDGIATGGTMRAAIEVARRHGARRVVVAVPVAAPETVRELAAMVDDIVTVATPSPFVAIGQWYDDFAPTTDNEVRDLLARAPSRAASLDPPTIQPPVPVGQFDSEVEVSTNRLRLPGHLTVPADARGLVLFAHGSGSSRVSPRNRLVAERLQAHGLATLQFDLLSADESTERGNVFDVELLAVRLLAATAWARERSPCAGLTIGYFGASTGAAAALWAAAEDSTIGAVVSRGGRPDLAAARLAHVHAPTLLIVGGDDSVVVDLNRLAAEALRCEHDLAVIPGASHLFKEPGALEQVARLASAWFVPRLAAVTRADAHSVDH